MLAIACPHCGENLKVGHPTPHERMQCSRCGQLVPCPSTVSRGNSGPATILTPPPSLDQSAPTPVPGSTATAEPIDFLRPPQKPDELGRLGAYRVLKVLGVGGMGIVFHAEDVE